MVNMSRSVRRSLVTHCGGPLNGGPLALTGLAACTSAVSMFMSMMVSLNSVWHPLVGSTHQRILLAQLKVAVVLLTRLVAWLIRAMVVPVVSVQVCCVPCLAAAVSFAKYRRPLRLLQLRVFLCERPRRLLSAAAEHVEPAALGAGQAGKGKAAVDEHHRYPRQEEDPAHRVDKGGSGNEGGEAATATPLSRTGTAPCAVYLP